MHIHIPTHEAIKMKDPTKLGWTSGVRNLPPSTSRHEDIGRKTAASMTHLSNQVRTSRKKMRATDIMN
jgi:hypothetical protein